MYRDRSIRGPNSLTSSAATGSYFGSIAGAVVGGVPLVAMVEMSSTRIDVNVRIRLYYMAMTAGARFCTALEAERPLQIVGTINAYTALLAERAGYKAIYLSGAGVAN